MVLIYLRTVNCISLILLALNLFQFLICVHRAFAAENSDCERVLGQQSIFESRGKTTEEPEREVAVSDSEQKTAIENSVRTYFSERRPLNQGNPIGITLQEAVLLEVLSDYVPLTPKAARYLLSLFINPEKWSELSIETIVALGERSALFRQELARIIIFNEKTVNTIDNILILGTKPRGEKQGWIQRQFQNWHKKSEEKQKAKRIAQGMQIFLELAIATPKEQEIISSRTRLYFNKDGFLLELPEVFIDPALPRAVYELSRSSETSSHELLMRLKTPELREILRDFFSKNIVKTKAAAELFAQLLLGRFSSEELTPEVAETLCRESSTCQYWMMTIHFLAIGTGNLLLELGPTTQISRSSNPPDRPRHIPAGSANVLRAIEEIKGYGVFLSDQEDELLSKWANRQGYLMAGAGDTQQDFDSLIKMLKVSKPQGLSKLDEIFSRYGYEYVGEEIKKNIDRINSKPLRESSIFKSIKSKFLRTYEKVGQNRPRLYLVDARDHYCWEMRDASNHELDYFKGMGFVGTYFLLKARKNDDILGKSALERLFKYPYLRTYINKEGDLIFFNADGKGRKPRTVILLQKDVKLSFHSFGEFFYITASDLEISLLDPGR